MSVRSVLIVDDPAGSAPALQRRLAGCAFRVTILAEAGAESIAAAAMEGRQVVVIDASLSGASAGVALADELRGRSVPVVLITTGDASAADPVAPVEPFGSLAVPYSDRELRLAVELARYRYDSSRQVHELEDRFFSIAADLLCFLDFDGYFKRLNPAWERTLGFTRTELMSRPFIEFVHPDDRERTLSQNREVRGGGQALGFENRYRCKDGSYRWLLWNAAPDADERVIYSVARDITERKLAEAERDRLMLELKAALAEVRTLQEILPICSYCKRIRDDENYWQSVEGYISERTSTRFSHSICPSCYTREVEPQLDALDA